LLRELAAGCLAGVCEYTVCQPVDMVATRSMLATGDSASKVSMLKEIRAIYQEGGLKSLFRGLGPQLMAAVPATCGMYAGERFFARIFEKPDGSTDLARTWAAGTCSGVTETVSVCPFEVLKVRLQSKEFVGRYANTLDALRSVIRDEGLLALYSGALPMAYRNCIFNGTFFAGCHLIRERMFPRSLGAAGDFGADLLCGTVMGAVATPAKMPFFVVKTRKQAAAGRDTHYNYPKGTFSTMSVVAKQVASNPKP
jgi:solute carrier family 25 2-oxodicarboxylate transporter 21